MPCAYCGATGAMTREHVFPQSIANLYPECDVVFQSGKPKYVGESVVKDVCPTCNNEYLGALDNYGKYFIENYFLNNTLDSVKVKYSYDLILRWLLKIAFNSERANCNNNYLHFFEANTSYILGLNQKKVGRISTFLGLYKNWLPVPEGTLFHKQPMYVSSEIRLYPKGFLESRYIQEDGIKIPGSTVTFQIRLANALFVCVVWDNDLATIDINRNIKWFTKNFPYTLLQEIVKLPRYGKVQIHLL